jgi:ribosomal subunit interface protein
MKITIKSKNLEITPAFNVFINNKLKSLGKIVGEDNSEISIEISKETEHHRHGEIFWASGNLIFDGKKISAQERSENAKKAVAKILKEIKIEFKKYKLKNKDSVRREQRTSKKILLTTDEIKEDGSK